MAMVFKDRQSTHPNRYKVTDETGKSYYVTLERADNPTVVGTPLNAATLNELANHTHDAEALRVMLASGNAVLSSHQYGTSLPAAGVKGRIFFKKVSD